MNRRYLFALTFILTLTTGYLLAGLTNEATATTALDPRQAPAAAPLHTTLDSLPMGEYEMSTFRNGESFEFKVKDGEILKIKVDGDTIAEEDFGQYRARVEAMLGHPSGPRLFQSDVSEGPFDLWNEEEWETRMEDFGREWERFGEKLSRSMEDMFEFRQDGSVYRFEFHGDDIESLEFDLDSLLRQFPDGRGFHQWDGEGPERMKTYDLDELIAEKQRMEAQREREIEEMETMIDQLERRKAARQNVQLLDMDQVIDLLRAEDLLTDETVNRVDLTQERLLINGNETSEAATRRAWELYVGQGRNFPDDFRYEREGVSW